MLRIGALLGLMAAALTPAAAQGFSETLSRANAADSAGHHAEAATLYEQAYRLSGFDPTGLAIAAMSAAAAGDRVRAFHDLNQSIDAGYLEPRVLAEKAFDPIRGDPRWKPMEAKLRRKLAALNQPLRDELLQMEQRDQANRQQFGAIMTRYGSRSPQGDSAMRALNAADAPIQERMQAIVGQYGWPTRTMVANDGAHAAWLVVQHMPKDFQSAVVEKVLAAVKAGEAQPGDGALLQDRVLVGSGLPQIYGTQLTSAEHGGPPTLAPIADEPCVDVRRRRVGLEPLADYLKPFGITYLLPGKCTVAP